jgi:hypothetical protein
MIRLRNTCYFKIISILFTVIFLFPTDILFSVAQKERMDIQFQRSKSDYSKGEYEKASIRLKRLIAGYESMIQQDEQIDIETKCKQGQILLLLAACCEKLQKEKEARENYTLAIKILGKNFVIEGIKLKGLAIYKEIKKSKIETEGNIICKVSTKKKRVSPYLIAGVVVVAAIVVYFLTKKKPQRTLTVTVGEGVDGTPASGTFNYKSGSTVSYNYTLRSGYSSLVVKLDGNDVAASGTIKMDQNHTLTATASKQYTLTVIKGVGVDGTPDGGTFSYNAGDTVNYAYSLQTGYKDLVVTLDQVPVNSTGTITMNGNHILAASAAPKMQYTLNVIKDDGINGTPESGTYPYDENVMVSYNYSLKSGYTNLEVTLDGGPVTFSGTIPMNGNHTLKATAKKIWKLTVNRGPGVDGDPNTGVYDIADGEPQLYNYSLKYGYKNLVVTLDGSVVKPSGSITMNKDHTLVATAKE